VAVTSNGATSIRQPDPADPQDKVPLPSSGGTSLPPEPPAAAPSPIDRLLRHLRLEDVLLFAWLIVGPLLLPGQVGDTALDRPDPLAGLLGIVALCGVAVCLGSRSRDGIQSGLVAGGDVAYAVGPLTGALLFALYSTNAHLGLGDGLAWLPIALAIAAGVAAHWLLAPLAIEQRRALVVPFVLLTSGAFSEMISGIAGIFDLRLSIDAIRTGQLSETLFVVGLGTLACLVFYVMFVFAPRQIAEREGTPVNWAVRFGAFVLSLSLGTTLRAVVG
jgi:hypothetical protein